MIGPSRKDRLLGGLYGLLIGDALGVPYEFRSPRDIPPIDQIEMDPPDGRRAHMVKAGTWSDDGAQALGVLDTFLKGRGEGAYERLADNLVGWMNRGDFAVNRHVFDRGNTTMRAVFKLQSRTGDARLCGLTGEYDNGNGSLMRVLPLALLIEDLDELATQAMEQSRLTHGHPISQICCAIYCVWAHGLLHGGDSVQTWLRALAATKSRLPEDQLTWWKRVEAELNAPPTGTGYVVDCLRSARAANDAPDYAAVVRTAIAFGHDTDTTACVAGGIAGIRFGQSGIPNQWLSQLRGRSIVEPLADALVAGGDV